MSTAGEPVSLAGVGLGSLFAGCVAEGRHWIDVDDPSSREGAHVAVLPESVYRADFAVSPRRRCRAAATPIRGS